MKFRFLFFLFFPILTYAQQIIKGKIIEKNTKLPLEKVVVISLQSGKWAVTNTNGEFSFKEKVVDELSIKFMLLGKVDKTITYYNKQLEKMLIVEMEDETLHLDAVEIVAKKGNKFSEIVLSKEAIQQVQSYSLNEVLQQLPGQEVTDLYLSNFKPIVFRTTAASGAEDEDFGNKSFGTAIVVNDIPLSNNENMQSFTGNFAGPYFGGQTSFGTNTTVGDTRYFNNANYGVDLREISTGNIEKIEIVQGIPSAKFGDLTSGLIKIEKRAGQSPFRVYTSLKNGVSEYNITKGLKLSEKIGYINLSFNYLNFNSDPRTDYSQYERISTDLMWTWADSKKNLINTFSVSYNFNDDDVKEEEEDLQERKTINEKRSFSISNRFKWNKKTTLFDQFNINSSFNYAKQRSYDSKLINIGGEVVGASLEEGVYEGSYTSLSYYATKEVEGIPISAYLAVDFQKFALFSKWRHNISYGLSYRLSDNNGRGRLGSPESTLAIFSGDTGDGGSSFRPYNFGDEVQAESQYSAYAEDKIDRNWENSSLNISAGLRYDNQNSYSVLSPRINTYFVKHNLKLRGGFGFTSKAPSLNQLYTGPRYYDIVLGDYRLPGYYNIGIVQTFLDGANNANLKPSRSMRTELGLDYKLKFVEFNITGFYNRLFDGFTNQKVPLIRELADLQINYNGIEKPTYDIIGYSPYYYTENEITNALESVDKGVEFFINFNKTLISNLSFNIQGSYIETRSNSGAETFKTTTDFLQPEKFGIYKSHSVYSKMFRIGGNITYHLPKVGLVISVRNEHFIIDEYNYQYKYPYAYLDEDLNKVEILEENRSNEELYGHIFSNLAGNSYKNTLDRIYHNLHLRISKDFLNGFRFSFYANNFLDLSYTYVVEGVTKPYASITSLSFGTKLEYQF